MNFPLALYNRQRPSRFLSAASPFIAVLLTLLIGCLIFAGMGKDPMHSMYVFIVEPLLTLRGWGELGVKMTPLILCALGLLVCYRANVWNIGAEGQLIVGALAGGAVIKNAKFVLTFPEGEACGFAYNNTTFNKSDDNLSLATLENLSVVTTNYYAESSALMNLKPDRLHMNKVYVRINGNAELGAYTEASSLRRALFRLDQSINDGAKDQFKGDVKDVYVVTGTFIPIANGLNWNATRDMVTYAYNDLDKLGSFTHNDNRPTEINYCKIKSGNAAGSAESKLFGTEVSDNEYYTYYYGAHPDYANGGIARFDTVAELKATGVTQVGDWIAE